MRVTEAELARVFSEKEVKAFIQRRQKAVAGNVDLGWCGVFSFPSILKLARHFGAIHETDEEIDMLRVVRNRIAHSGNEIVNNYQDVEVLAKAKEIISSLVQGASS